MTYHTFAKTSFSKNSFVVSGVKEKSFKKIKISENSSDKLDKIFLNKWLAFPIFALIMFLIYYLSVGVIGSFTVDLIGGIFESLGEIVGSSLEKIGTSEWVNSLVVDGIIAGVGAVLGFVPQLIILFVCMLGLTGCVHMVEITDEESEMIARTAAWLLFKYDNNYKENLITPTPTVTPTPVQATPTPVPDEVVEPTKAPDASEGNVQEIVLPEFNASVDETLRISDLHLEYDGYELCNAFNVRIHFICCSTRYGIILVYK